MWNGFYLANGDRNNSLYSYNNPYKMTCAVPKQVVLLAVAGVIVEKGTGGKNSWKVVKT